MSKRQIAFIIILTVAVAVSLSVLVGTTIGKVNLQTEQQCFNELAETSKHLADDIKAASVADCTILTAIAEIVSGIDDPTNDKLCKILSTYRFEDSYISYTELLCPDDTMLDMDGTVRDVSDALHFADEAIAGAYISSQKQSTLDPNELVIRNAVPVVRDGKTIYMLYGVIRLSDLAEKYRADIYDGQAYVFIVDGDTGDFLLDTWHKTLGNIKDFTDRRLEPGYSWKKVHRDLHAGKSGRLAFTSTKISDVVFMRYDPTGINNWSVALVVPQEIAMNASETVSNRLYHMAALIGLVMVLYMACVTWCLFRAYRKVRKLGNEDQTTGLQNRNAYDRYFADIQSKSFSALSCIFVDVNGLHDVNNKYGHKVGDQMLQIVAGALRDEFPFNRIFRIGGDEFVVISEDIDAEICAEKMERVSQRVASHDYSIAYGIAYRENEMGADRITQEADARMLESKRIYYAEHDRRRK